MKQREIKFRAWDKKLKSWVSTKFNTEWDSNSWNLIITNKNCILSQYTGLKDKNGVEIYEGDILRWNHMQKGFKPEYSYHLVKWDTLEATMDNPEWIGFEGDLECEEIIGNIYQNKELLK